MIEKWQIWEQKIQRRLGLDPTVCSGNQFQDPGDATSHKPRELFQPLVECKYTDRRSFTLRADKLANWCTTSILRGKMPVWAIQFGNRPDDTPSEFVVLSLDDFEELLEKAREIDTVLDSGVWTDRTWQERDERRGV